MALSLNPSLNPSPRASVSCPEDASLPLVLCNLLQKEFSGARSPVVGGIGPMGAMGKKGEKGYEGCVGNYGDKGFRGNTGANGFAGTPGLPVSNSCCY